MSKRDGGIKNNILDGCGKLITERKEIAKELLKTLAEFQINPNIPVYEHVDFPSFLPEEIGNVESILASLSHGKAISWDSISDLIFSKSYKSKSCKILSDFWSNLLYINPDHFTCRLIPLNKKFPNLPTRHDMRPIIFQSTLLKLTEGCILPELRDYLYKNLHSSQTGFVSTYGIYTNIHCALEEILSHTKKKIDVTDCS